MKRDIAKTMRIANQIITIPDDPEFIYDQILGKFGIIVACGPRYSGKSTFLKGLSARMEDHLYWNSKKIYDMFRCDKLPKSIYNDMFEFQSNIFKKLPDKKVLYEISSGKKRGRDTVHSYFSNHYFNKLLLVFDGPQDMMLDRYKIKLPKHPDFMLREEIEQDYKSFIAPNHKESLTWDSIIYINTFGKKAEQYFNDIYTG